MYTLHGYHIENVKFNPAKWQNLLDKSRKFWFLFVAPELISSNLRKQTKPTTQDLLAHETSTTEEPTTAAGPLSKQVYSVRYPCGLCHSVSVIQRAIMLKALNVAIATSGSTLFVLVFHPMTVQLVMK